MQISRSCDSCQAYFAHTTEDGSYIQSECRLNPPVLAGSQVHEGDYAVEFCFPIVTPESYCMQYRSSASASPFKPPSNL